MFHHWRPDLAFERLKFIRFLLDIIKKRVAAETHSRDDFFSFVVEAEDENGRRLTTNELWEEAIFLLPAGKRFRLIRTDDMLTAIQRLRYYVGDDYCTILLSFQIPGLLRSAV